MSSPEQKSLFPPFAKRLDKDKQSPTKNMLSLKNMSSKQSSHNMKMFFQNKIAKGLKLNNLNDVNSIHESVYNASSNISEQNSMRNLVNTQYIQNLQQSVLSNMKLKDKQFSKQISQRKMLQRQLDSPLISNFGSKINEHKLSNIRSRSSSNLSSHKLGHSKQKLFTNERIENVTKKQNFDQSQPQLANSNYLQENINSFFKQQETQLKKFQLPLDQQIQMLFTERFQRNFIQDLISFMNKDWAKSQADLLQDRKIQMMLNIIMTKFASLQQITNDFLSLEFMVEYNTNENHKNGQKINSSIFTQVSNYSIRQIKLLTSILFKQCQKTFEEMKKLFEQLISKLPQEGIIEQEFVLDELKKNILELYDPKFTYSSQKMKQRFKLYYQVYCTKRNSLETQIKHKLKPQLTFIKEMQSYLSSYQKQLIKLNSKINNLEKQKEHLLDLLKQKTTFKPIQIDYKELAELKNKSEEKMKRDFQENIVKFHNTWHQKDAETIQSLQIENKRMKKQVEQKQRQKQYHISKLEQYLNNRPFKKDASTQIFNIPLTTHNGLSSNNSQQTSVIPISPYQLSMYPNFLQNIVTPFTFNERITCSLISVITIDKILYDYEPIKSKSPLMSFKHYLYEWFIIRTGSKKIAQILIKNFLYSVKKFRNKHKRFFTFNRICGFASVRGKNLQEDVEHLFYQTNLAWYYLVKLALMYRKKLNENPTGYHIFPPINCEQIFKLSLRKGYELVQQFFTQEGIEVPENLTQKIDHYSINQISKFKQSDEEFTRQMLQQIHILRQMNFDTIAGFALDYIASEKSILIEALLRSIHLKQQQDKAPIGYNEFQVIYRKYYKQKRSKIELIYSKFCLCNMLDVLNAENLRPMILMCIEDESQLRSIFDKHQSLKTLVITEKQGLMNGTALRNQSRDSQKISLHPNSFQHFRQRYYQEFYDFYDMTIMLEEVYKITKGLVKKRLKKITKEQKYIQCLLQGQKEQKIKQEEVKKQNQDQQGSDQQSEQEEKDPEQNAKKPSMNISQQNLLQLGKQKSQIEHKLHEWNKIQERIPHFTNRILTIDQIVVHNMRRKQMLEGCEFAWRTLREILVIISK